MAPTSRDRGAGEPAAASDHGGGGPQGRRRPARCAPIISSPLWLLMCVVAAIDRRTIRAGRVGLVLDGGIELSTSELADFGFTPRSQGRGIPRRLLHAAGHERARSPRPCRAHCARVALRGARRRTHPAGVAVDGGSSREERVYLGGRLIRAPPGGPDSVHSRMAAGDLLKRRALRDAWRS